MKDNRECVSESVYNKLLSQGLCVCLLTEEEEKKKKKRKEE